MADDTKEGGVQVTIGGDSSALSDAIVRAKENMSDFAEALHGNLSSSVGEASDGLGSLSEILREHRQEHMGTARAAHMFTAELDSLMGKGSELGSVLGGLAGGLAAGGAVGLAFEGAKEAAKLIAEGFKGIIEEAEKLDKTSLATINASLSELEKGARNEEEALAKMQGVDVTGQSLKRAYEVAQQAVKNLQSQDEAYSKAAAKSAWLRTIDETSLMNTEEEHSRAVGKAQSDMFRAANALSDYKRAKAAEDALKQEKEDAKELDRQEKAHSDAVDKEVAEIKRAEAEKAKERDKARKEREKEDRESERIGEEIEKLEAAATAKFYEGMAAADRATNEQRIRNLRAEVSAFESSTSQEDAIWKKSHEENARADQKRMELAKKDQQLEVSIAKSIAGTWEQAFTQMIAGNESAQKAILEAIVKSVQEAVMAYAAQAEAATIAANSAVPFGLIGAIAAGGVAFGVVEALIAKLPSASGGYDIPTGINPIVQAHGGEMVLPADIAGPLRNLAAGGGAGGNGATFHVNAVDGASVKRMIESDDFKRSWAEATRNGRL